MSIKVQVKTAYPPELQVSQFEDKNGNKKQYMKTSFIGVLNGTDVRISGNFNIDFREYLGQTLDFNTLTVAKKADGTKVVDKANRPVYTINRADEDALVKEVYTADGTVISPKPYNAKVEAETPTQATETQKAVQDSTQLAIIKGLKTQIDELTAELGQEKDAIKFYREKLAKYETLFEELDNLVINAKRD